VLRHDYSLTFKFEIRPFDGDDADLQVHRKLMDGRDGSAFGPVAHRNSLLDLLDDLKVDWK
jgi:hypothetical protein